MKRLFLSALTALFVFVGPVPGVAQDEDPPSPDKIYIDQMTAIDTEVSTCLEKGFSTSEILECLQNGNAKYDKVLNDVYKALRTTVKDDTALFEGLKTEQLSWIKLRELMINRLYAQAEGGTIGPVNSASLSNDMLKDRINLLLTLWRYTFGE